MKNYLILLILTLFIFTGCITAPQPQPDIHTIPQLPDIIYEEPSSQKSEAFHTAISKVALTIKNDSTYNKMNLDTSEKKEWFKHLMYQLWDRQITRQVFISKGLERYPTHNYEFLFVANGFQKGS